MWGRIDMKLMTSALLALSVLALAGCAPGTGGAVAPAGGPASPATIATEAGGTEDELRAAAQGYVDAINTQDRAAATNFTCSRADAGVSYQELATELDGVVEIANVIFGPQDSLVQIGRVGREIDVTAPLFFRHDGQRWCITA